MSFTCRNSVSMSCCFKPYVLHYPYEKKQCRKFQKHTTNPARIYDANRTTTTGVSDAWNHFFLTAGEPDKELNPKKKVWEQIQPDLRTDERCVATYKGAAFEVAGKGVCKAQTMSNSGIKWNNRAAWKSSVFTWQSSPVTTIMVLGHMMKMMIMMMMNGSKYFTLKMFNKGFGLIIFCFCFFLVFQSIIIEL